MKPSVVFHADDLGISAGVNRGVARALEAGLVRAVSLCATGDAFEEGAAIAARSEGLDVGLHFCLTLGRALSGPIEGVTDPVGRFPARGRLLARSLAGLPVTQQIRRELEAQLERLERAGLSVDHLDGHHHVHAFPVIRDVVEAEAAARGLRLRVSRDADGRGRRGLRGRVLEALTFGRQGDLPFTGLALWGQPDYDERLRALLADPPAPAFEIAVHPREEDAALRRLDRVRGETHADVELATLTDPASVRALRELCRPVRFRDLALAGG